MERSFFLRLLIIFGIVSLVLSQAFLRAEVIEKSELVFFYSPYCNSCLEADIVLEKTELGAIKIKKVNVQEPGSLALMMRMLVESNNAPSLAGQVPAFFINNQAQIGFYGEQDLINFITFEIGQSNKHMAS